jgi:hypothetical protein
MGTHKQVWQAMASTKVVILMTESKVRSGGIGFASVLCLIFITLKLTDNIDWAWVWVLAPFWIPWSVLVVVAVIVGFVAVIRR